MSRNLVATATILIEADRSKVWDALVTPEAIKQYMFGADVKSDWEIGAEITWSGEVNGARYEDKGEILELVPTRKLAYSHFSPMSGQRDEPENYHTVVVQLSEDDGETRVSLSQDNNPDEKSQAESEKNWSAMLQGLKEYVESNS